MDFSCPQTSGSIAITFQPPGSRPLGDAVGYRSAAILPDVWGQLKSIALQHYREVERQDRAENGPLRSGAELPRGMVRIS